jgi:GNAT superfamily N-acetyltransferase
MGEHSSGLLVRPARRADLGAIVHLLADDALGAQRESVTTPLPAAYAAAFDAIMADSNHELVVAELGGTVVGTLQLTVIPYLTYQGGRRALIEAVRVSRTHRDRGIGAALLQWVIARARARGCHLVQLTTDKRRPDARRFYERLGFEATHEGMKLFLT